MTRSTDLCYRFVVCPSFLCSFRKRTIPSPRPRFAPPSRAATVKGGHQADAFALHP
jgi:hypothetical protein